MPVGAIVGGAVIAGGASVYGAKKNSKAIKKASSAQQQSTDQQTALQRETYAQNAANLSPFMQRGKAAGNEVNALLGLGTGGFIPNTAPSPQGTVQPAQSPAQAATDAYEIFKQSTGYSTRLAEGNRSLASNYFGGGVGQSGAAVKAALRYGQDYASNEFGKYLGYLGNQQGVGLAGASALAGVSQNYANNMSNISQNNANMQGQAAIAGAQNNGALWTGLAGIAGQTAGALSSYRPQPYNYAALAPSVTATMNANPAIF
jgi:hypothetical protein